VVVVVLVLVLVDVEEVDVTVVVTVVIVGIVLEVDVVVGIPAPQCALKQAGGVSLAPSLMSSVTRHVSDGSAQCVNGMMARSHSVAASHRGAVGSTQAHPAKKENP
jgi:hypothetical protein